jgi:DNA processing protein
MALRAHRLGARLVTPDDAEWPRQLDDLVLVSREGQEPTRRDTDPPVCLWVRGRPPLDEAFARSVAVVGSRAATSYGNTIAAELAYGLAGLDWTIVSGGAFGIDAQAHRAAMAAGGLTVAVLACGIDTPYPAAHAVLFERIAEDGLIVTEWPPGSEPFKTRFLTRNRCIAAATRGTVMVEAGARSGARNTLTHARRLGRAAMVVPGPVTSAMSVGCHVELRRADTVLVTSVEEVVEEIGAIGDLAPLPTVPTTPSDLLGATEQKLLDAVSPRKFMTAEEIAANAGVSGTEARQALPGLEEAGFVVSTGEGTYRLPPRTVRGATRDDRPAR